ncbi:MAG TPA: ADP-L-glycero-D-mannoheptose-6-epimerase, partial [Rhabdochlamydiaceae bacterium]|nr:ADP-L-glycero-D-mannoheptose-6-epimerase [Rhabdochlamydiaceae bacterium]
KLAAALFSALDQKTKINFIDMPESLAGKYQNYTCAEMGKYRQKLGIGPQQPHCRYSIGEAVRDYAQNYLLKDERW